VDAEELALAIGDPVRDTVTAREGEVRWVSRPGQAPAVVVRWDDDGHPGVYGGEEIGGRLVRRDLTR
jgi:hypothetical protein